MSVPLKIPIYSKGRLDQLNEALESGIFQDIDRVIWHYVTEGEAAGSLILVYADKSLHYIKDATLAANVAALAERITANETNIATLDEGLQTVIETLERYADWAETVNDSITEINGRLDALESVTASQGEAIEGLTTLTSEHTATLTAQANRISTAEATLETQSTTLADHGTRLTSAEGAIEDNTTAINANAADIAAHEAALESLSEKVEVPELEGLTVPEYVEQQINDAISVDFV